MRMVPSHNIMEETENIPCNTMETESSLQEFCQRDGHNFSTLLSARETAQALLREMLQEF